MLSIKEVEHLKILEYSLWKDDTRFDPVYMENILHSQFFEFGRSGRVYERSDTIYIGREIIDAELKNIQIHEISENTVLITYKSFVKYESMEIGNRSSVWVKIGNDWKLYFHQ
jgi:hypothetical protein